MRGYMTARDKGNTDWLNEAMASLEDAPSSARSVEGQFELLHSLLNVWQKHPQMRLMQLLINALNNSESYPELYYIDDAELIDKLKMFDDKHSGL